MPTLKILLIAVFLTGCAAAPRQMGMGVEEWLDRTWGKSLVIGGEHFEIWNSSGYDYYFEEDELIAVRQEPSSTRDYKPLLGALGKAALAGMQGYQEGKLRREQQDLRALELYYQNKGTTCVQFRNLLRCY